MFWTGKVFYLQVNLVGEQQKKGGRSKKCENKKEKWGMKINEEKSSLETRSFLIKTILENDWGCYRCRCGARLFRQRTSCAAPRRAGVRCTSGPGGPPSACSRTRLCRSCSRRRACAACSKSASTSFSFFFISFFSFLRRVAVDS